jgi:hypothetical protein
MWRDPSEETENFPGFFVHDGRMTGSITLGPTRLPLWTTIAYLLEGGYDYLAEHFDLGETTQEDLFDLLYNLLEVRGEFARLLLALANAERIEAERIDDVIQTAADEDHPAVKHKDDDVIVTVIMSDDEDEQLPMPDPWWKDDELKAPVIELLESCLAILKGTDDEEHSR